MIEIDIEKIDRNLSAGQRTRLGLAVDDPRNAMVRFHVNEHTPNLSRNIATIEMPFIRPTEGTREERKAAKRALRSAIKAAAQLAIDNDEADEDGLNGLEGRIIQL